jgi:hypothetical protein
MESARCQSRNRACPDEYTPNHRRRIPCHAVRLAGTDTSWHHHHRVLRRRRFKKSVDFLAVQIESLPALIPTKTDHLRDVQRLICTASVIRHIAPLHGRNGDDERPPDRIDRDASGAALERSYHPPTIHTRTASGQFTSAGWREHSGGAVRSRSIGRAVTCRKVDCISTRLSQPCRIGGLRAFAKLPRCRVVSSLASAPQLAMGRIMS